MADVFLSYSHADNDNCSYKEDSKWVNEFHDRLQKYLRASCRADYFDRESGVFLDLLNRDSRVDIDDMIVSELNKSKVLVSVITGNYDASPYCLAEKDYFLTAGEGRNECNLQVEKVPYQEEGSSWLYQFHIPDKNRKSWDTCCIHVRPDLFQMRLTELANDIKEILKERHELSLQKNPVKRKKVFVSISSPDVNFRYRRVLISKLRDEYEIISSGLSYKNASDFTEKVNELMDEADFAIFILDSKSTRIPTGATETIEALQLDISRKSSIPRVIWLPRYYEESNKAQNELIEKYTLEDDGYDDLNISDKYPALKFGANAFITQIRSQLENTDFNNKEEVETNDKRVVYISTGETEVLESQAFSVFSKRIELLGFEVIAPNFQGTSGENRLDRSLSMGKAEFMVLWCTQEFSESGFNSLIGELKRATHVPDSHKMIFGRPQRSDRFLSINTVDTLVSQISK